MFGFGKQKLPVNSCFAGQFLELANVPDPVFSQKLLGDGFAIRPHETATTVDVLAPIAGTIKQLFATKHAFVISNESLSVLVHIGMDTVELKGDGLEALVEVGQEVAQGDAIVRMDAARIRELGKDPVTPVIFPEASQVANLQNIATGQVEANVKVCEVTLAK